MSSTCLAMYGSQSETQMPLSPCCLNLRFVGRIVFEAVPMAVLTAIIAPTVLATGPAETIAALVTLLLAWRQPVLVAVIGGVATVVLLRMAMG